MNMKSVIQKVLGTLILLNFVLLSKHSNAQNLVLNPGFEQFDLCQTDASFSPIDYTNNAQTWFNPSSNVLATPDYWFENPPCYDPVTNTPPTADITLADAQTGFGMSGIVVYNSLNSPSACTQGSRENITGQFCSPLVAGETYNVSYWVFLRNGSNTINSMSANISLFAPAVSNNCPMAIAGFPPNISSAPTPLILQQWVQITGTFTANGGEQYITIGNMATDANSNPTPMAGSFGSEVYVVIDDVSVAPVNPGSFPNPGTNGTYTTCNTGAPVNLFDQLGGTPDMGGSWSGSSTLTGGDLGTFDPTIATSGIYTYTVAGSPCSFSATVDVTITNSNAGVNSVINLCQNGVSANLFDQIGGTPDVGGSWSGPSALTGGDLGTFDPTIALAGTYIYTVDTGLCAVFSTLDVTLLLVPNAGLDAIISICQVGTPINLLNQLGGTPDTGGTWSGPSTLTGGDLGTFDPSTMSAGIYTYTTGTMPCTAAATVAITTTQQANAGASTIASICQGGSSVNLLDQLGGTPDTGGAWSGPSALTGGDLGTFNPSTMLAGTYTYSVGVSPCDAASTVNVTLITTADAGINGTVSVCQDATVLNLFDALGGTPDIGGIWSGPSVVTGGDLGEFDPSTMVSGTYTYTVGVTPCTASSSVDVTVSPLPIIDAGIDETLCEGELFTLSGTGGTSYIWNNGVIDGQSFEPPLGTTAYSVVGQNANGCIATDQITLSVVTSPEPQFTTDITEGCLPLTVLFSNITSGNSSSCQWIINGETINACDFVNYTFDQAGVYDVALSVTNNNGCFQTISVQNLITVYERPSASFTVFPTVISTFNNEITFTNTSLNADSYLWHFGDSTISTEVNPTHEFNVNGGGTFEVTLEALNNFGCRDSFSLIISKQEEVIFYIPNAFTPDGDEFNQTFEPVFASGLDAQDYTFTLFNRWGELIFVSQNPAIGWDGTYNGFPVQDGTYTWQVEFKTTLSDERRREVGHVTLIR